MTAPTPLMNVLRRVEDWAAAPKPDPPEPRDFLEEVEWLAPYSSPVLRAALDQVDNHVCMCEWCRMVIAKPRQGMPGAISRFCANRLLESILDPKARRIESRDGRVEIVSDVIDGLLDEAIEARKRSTPSP